MVQELWAALRATGFPCLCTIAGAASVFLVGRQPSPGGQRIMDGFAAGVMMAASVFSLLLPAIEQSGSWMPAALGFLLGAVFLLAAEGAAGSVLEERAGGRGRGRMVMAVTLHNLPEGMVVGLAAALAVGGSPEATAGAAALSLGIGLQDLPEGAAVSLPLYQSGKSKPAAFLAGVGSGLVEPLGGVLAALLAVWVCQLMPWLLAGAAGVMMGITAQDLLPGAAVKNDGALAFLLGFALMMAMDVAL